MRVKAIAVLIIVAVSGAAFMAMRYESRADAAAGDCYAAALNSLLCSTSGGRISSTASNRT